MKKPRKQIFYAEEFDLHFNNMYKDIFKNNYDTFDNRYNWCYREYMTGIKYNRSQRRYDHTSNRCILAAMFQKDKIEHRTKHEELAYDVILPIQYIKPCLPSKLPNPILNIIYSYYNALQPFVRELQDWFGEDSDSKNYHINDYEAQASLIFDVIDVDKYFLNSNLNEIVRTEYFKSQDIIYCTDDTPYLVEIKIN